MSPLHRSRPHALTLVELVVVLLIMVVVSSVALQSTDRVVQQGRFDATTRQLEEVRFAIQGPRYEADAAGTRRLSGFAADLGRLPNLQPGAPGAELSELWDGSALAPYGAYQAAEDGGVSIVCGWRGPYLNARLGAALSIRDGWSRPFVYLDPSNAPTAAGSEVSRVLSYGSDGQADTGSPAVFERDLEPLDLDEARIELIVQVDLKSLPPGERAVLVLYEPNAAGTNLRADVRVLQATTAGVETVTLAGLVRGPKVLRAYRGVGYDLPQANFDASSERSAPADPTLFHQTEVVEIELP